MGFRSMSEFNISLFGKNYWKILSCDDSQVGKMFKDRYYPMSSVEDSFIGYAPSYAWRSILSARDLSNKGVR